MSSSGKGKTACGWSAVAATEHCAQENPWPSDHQGSRRNFCWTCGHWGGNMIKDFFYISDGFGLVVGLVVCI